MKKIVLSLAALAIIFSSCEENPLLDGSDNTNKSYDQLTDSEFIVNDDATVEDVLETCDYEVDYFAGSTQNIEATLNEASQLTLKSGGNHRYGDRHKLRYLYSIAPDISIDTADAGYPITITLDYGDSTVLMNGKVLSGQVVITISAPPRTDGAQIFATFNEFFVDSIGIEGYSSHTFDISDDSSTVSLIYNRELTFVFPDETTVELSEDRVREWVSGVFTPYDLSDDEIHITGGAILISREGVTYQRTITQYLVKLGTCRFVVSGLVEFSIDNEIVMALDYGDGECDDEAVISRHGEETTINIGKNIRRKIQQKHQNGNR